MPERFTIGNVEYQRSVVKEGFYRFKDENGNTGYISEDVAYRAYKENSK